MTPEDILTIEEIEKLLFDIQHINIQTFKYNLNKSNQNVIETLIEILIVEDKFYQYFRSSYLNTLAFHYNQTISQRIILNYGYDVVSELFSSKSMFLNEQFVMIATLKHCDLDIFLLIAIAKGYLLNSTIKRDKIKTFFIQYFKKNNNHFAGIQRFTQFHQYLIQKSPTANTYTINQSRRQQYNFQLSYFLAFYQQNRDFFPSTLQITNLLFKMMTSLKLQTQEEIKLYERFQRQYFNQNQYHLVTTCKNIRFLIQFFRNPFNQKIIEFYPQKVFLKIISKYKHQQVDKILSYSEVGLTWNEEQINTSIGNIFKLGLTTITFTLFNSLLKLWLKNGLIDVILKISQNYIPKVFIFMKHQKLFDAALSFLQQFTLGPRIPTINILNKLLQKLLPFRQKDCPTNKKRNILEFMLLIESKYEKIATLEDKNYIQLKNVLKNIRQVQKQQFLQQQQVKQKQKLLQWQQSKVSLFIKSGAQNKISGQKQFGEYRGLYNIGNSCYMNSFLQCLYMTIEFRYNILNQSTLELEQKILQKIRQSQDRKSISNKTIIEWKQTQTNQQPHHKSLIARQYVRPTAQLQRLFAQLMRSKRPSLSPITIKNVSSLQFKNTFQQDTIQFGRSFLDIITKSSVQNIFQGEQTNEIICPNCQQSRFKKENFIDIMLTDYYDKQIMKDEEQYVKSDNQGLKVGTMMQKFFQTQQMQGLTCDYCEVKSLQSLKKHYISKLPNYLILTMKRFCYDKKENKNVKKHYRIDLSDGLIKVEGQLYQLYGIIVHRGQSANSGHYFAFCKEWKFEETVVLQEEKLKTKGQNQMKKDGNNQNIQIEKNDVQFQEENSPQSNLNLLKQQQQMKNVRKKHSSSRWLCLNDCNVSLFESFHHIKQFFDINQQDTPYVLFYQKLSHLQSLSSQHLKHPIKLRQPLEKFLQKDNSDYTKFVQNKIRGNLNLNQVNWKNFGKVKGFTAYDFFKFTKQDDDQNGGGFGGGGFGNTPIL